MSAFVPCSNAALQANSKLNDGISLVFRLHQTITTFLGVVN